MQRQCQLHTVLCAKTWCSSLFGYTNHNYSDVDFICSRVLSFLLNFVCVLAVTVCVSVCQLFRERSDVDAVSALRVKTHLDLTKVMVNIDNFNDFTVVCFSLNGISSQVLQTFHMKLGQKPQQWCLRVENEKWNDPFLSSVQLTVNAHLIGNSTAVFQFIKLTNN